MKILDRYIIREYLKPFFYTFIAGLLIYLTAELFENIDILIDNKVPLSTSINFFLYETPKIIVEILPLTCLIAVLLTLTRLGRQNEITAIKVSGINIFRSIHSILFFTLILSIFVFIFNETIVPSANSRFKEIKEKDIYKRQVVYEGIKQNISYYNELGNMFFIKQLDPARGLINYITIYEFDKDYRLTKRIDAKESKWLGKYWILKDGYSRTFTPLENATIENNPNLNKIPTEDEENFLTGFGEKEMAVPIKMEKMFIAETPSDFSRQQKDPFELSFFNLRSYVHKMKNSGMEFRREMIELYTKISFPFTCFFIVLLGIPFAIKSGAKGTFILSIGISLLFGFTYWSAIALCKALGRSGVLHPILSAWGANIIAGIISLTMLRWTER